MNDVFLFFKTFLKNPVAVSSVIPTSQGAADRIADRIKPSTKPLTIVEYGPGTGVLCASILRKGILHKDSHIILIEKSPELAKHLHKRFRDKRVEVVHDSAENVERILRERGKKSADYVFSSIPLSVMPPSITKRILTATQRALHTDGTLIVFLFRYMVKDILKGYFPSIKTSFEVANLPPLFVFEARRRDFQAGTPKKWSVTMLFEEAKKRGKKL